MPGGLMQLAYAPSAQAQYIFGNPQITFWKAAYRRHTNFAMESREITDVSTPPVFGATCVYTIPRDTADLLHKMYFQTTLPNPSGSDVYCPYPGEKLLKEMSISIGGTTIDIQYSDWLHVWNELSLTAEQKIMYNKMIGHRKGLVIDGSGGEINVPLQFWFCRHVGLSLPRKALEQADVKLTIVFEEKAKMTRSSNTAPISSGTVGNLGELANNALYGDFIYLDPLHRYSICLWLRLLP